MAFLEWLEYSAVADWVAASLWGYPITLVSHGVGLAIVVGIIFMLSLRLLGKFDGIPYQSVLSYMKLAWVGFVLNLISGLMLFSAQATFFVTNTPFLIKIGSILIAAVVAALMQEKVRVGASAWDSGTAVPRKVKNMAIVSLVLWSIAIISGRLIAYL
jgi:hypothetical protein